MSAQLDAAKKALAAREKADEDRARQAQEAKPAKAAKPPPRGKKPWVRNLCFFAWDVLQ